MIKNIIFDFGDIFINLDKKATVAELHKLGIETISDEMIQAAKVYEKGLISSEEFINIHQEIFYFLTTQQLTFAWNAVLKDLPKHRLDFIKNLADSEKYRLFLLSNTNEMHISWIKENWGKDQFKAFKNCFEKFYLSHEIHLRKPDAEIFEFVLKENQLIAEETLFIDDVAENTATAEEMGIQVWNLVPGEEDVADLFIKNELLF